MSRTIQPMTLPSEAAEAIKDRFLNFARSLSTVIVFAFCTAKWVSG